VKIYYHSSIHHNVSPVKLEGEDNYLSLASNNWDDFHYKTTLNAALYLDGNLLELEDFHLKIFIDGEAYTAEKLDQLRTGGWDGFFPIPGVNYISIPSDIEFYSIITSKLGSVASEEFLSKLRDASYLIHTKKDKEALLLAESETFTHSLMRESGAIKAFEDGWSLLDNEKVAEINDFSLNLRVDENTSIPVDFKFQSGILPYDINVLIGPNGIGKSYSLRTLVEYWLRIGLGEPKLLKSQNHVPFDRVPNFSKLILVSYSPFEEFSLNFDDEELQDRLTYKYFGLRELGGCGKVLINKDLPEFNASQSLIKAISEDRKFAFVEKRVKKIPTALSVLKAAFHIPFDDIVLEVSNKKKLGVLVFSVIDIERKLYLPLDAVLGIDASEEDFLAMFKLESGVNFIKNGELLKLSSGQKLFTYMVINIIGEIKNNSLIIVDEPELFLHPTLEIEFISLLKEVLESFKSKAILATHSLSIVREVPSKCVHIFKNEGYGLDIVPPPFQTFGGDIQRISTYVFGENSVTKPFEELLDVLVKEHGSQNLIKMLQKEKNIINEEMIMEIMNLGNKYGR
jgi:energy-coupling factor transporter ATP-binding protein EcfA2